MDDIQILNANCSCECRGYTCDHEKDVLKSMLIENSIMPREEIMNLVGFKK